MRAVGVALVLAAGLLPAAALAQSSPDALTRLAQRIVESTASGPGGAKLYVAALPPSYTPPVPVPQATLLGSVLREPGTLDTGVAFTVPRTVTLYYDGAAGTRAAYETALAGAGYTAAPLPLPSSGGFAVALPQAVVRWCSADAARPSVMLQSPPAAGALDVTITDPSDGSSLGEVFGCRSRPGVAGALDMFKTPLPSFTAPDGVTILGGGPAFIGSTVARLVSSRGIDAVFGGFAAQLTSAGWSTNAPAGNTVVRSGTFAKTVDGRRWTASLTISAVDATHYDALSHAARADQPNPVAPGVPITPVR